VVLTSSYPKGRKIRLCTGGAVTILQCGTPIPIDEDDLKYGVEITHRVVWYFVFQKETKPTMNRYLNPSTNQNSFAIGANYINK